MKATSKYNLSKIFRNAWYMFKTKMCKTFAAALRKAWRSEKLAMLAAKIEGRNLAEEDVQAKTTTYNPELLTIPADYYGEYGRYYGD